jgi:hypothetical protein
MNFFLKKYVIFLGNTDFFLLEHKSHKLHKLTQIVFLEIETRIFLERKLRKYKRIHPLPPPAGENGVFGFFSFWLCQIVLKVHCIPRWRGLGVDSFKTEIDF